MWASYKIPSIFHFKVFGSKRYINIKDQLNKFDQINSILKVKMTFYWVNLPIEYITWRCIALKILSSWSLKSKSLRRLRLIMIKREEVYVKVPPISNNEENSKRIIGVLQ